jgi:hypothetical protein
MTELTDLPPKPPVPEEDGAADHLPGLRWLGAADGE